MSSKPGQDSLRMLPSVSELLDAPPAREALDRHPRAWVVESARLAIGDLRARLLEGDGGEATRASLLERAGRHFRDHLDRMTHARLRRVVNATGVVVHTNLGRSPLAESVARHMMDVATRYSNLEYDLDQGARGSRHDLIANLIAGLTGAEAACVVNNNAAAVFLVLSALTAGGEVIVSRGQLVEIGGSFRMPDIMAASGARLVEVGTTNKTHRYDYERAITQDTALLLKVHTSNFRMVGFTAEVGLEELVSIGRAHGVPVMEDLGSGCLAPLDRWIPEPEPTVQKVISTGVDAVTFSGDKMLGGPQAGLVVGRRSIVERVRTHPLMRMVRPDKLTLAGLEATLRLYADPEAAIREIPALAMITTDLAALDDAARRLAERIGKAVPELDATVVDGASRIGGGAMPLAEPPTRLLALRHRERSAGELAAALRAGDPPVIGRIEDDRFLIDPRTLLPGDEDDLVRRLVEAS